MVIGVGGKEGRDACARQLVDSRVNAVSDGRMEAGRKLRVCGQSCQRLDRGAQLKA